LHCTRRAEKVQKKYRKSKEKGTNFFRVFKEAEQNVKEKPVGLTGTIDKILKRLLSVLSFLDIVQITMLIFLSL